MMLMQVIANKKISLEYLCQGCTMHLTAVLVKIPLYAKVIRKDITHCTFSTV